MRKTAATLYLFGALQLVHAASHILPAVQSAAIITNQQYEGSVAERLRKANQNTNDHSNCNHKKPIEREGYSFQKISHDLMHHEYAGYAFGLVGLLSIGMGIADARKHKRQDKYIESLQEEIQQRDNYITELEKKLCEKL